MTTLEQHLNAATEKRRQEWLGQVEEFVSRVHYPRDGYKIEVAIDRADPHGRVFVQVLHWRPDAVTGVEGWGPGGKRYLSPWMTESEVVRVVLSAALAYEEHEVREFFRWAPSADDEPRAIMGPHIDVYALYEAADSLDVRA